MANESQYYSPIIQAMIASYQRQQQQAELQQRQVESKAAIEHQKAQEAEMQRQLDLHQEQIENEHEHAKESIRIEGERNQLAADQARANALLTMGHLGGLMKPGGLQTLAPLLSRQFGGQAPDLSGIMDSEALAQQRVKEAGQTAGAITEAQQPSRESLMQQENDFKSQLMDKELASRERTAKWERDTQVAMNNATNATHLKIANMQYQPDPSTLKQMQVAFATGEAQPNWQNPIERAAASTNESMGFRTPSKNDVQALQQAQSMEPLFQKLEGFANKYLPANKLSAMGQGLATQAGVNVGYPTDVQNQINQIRTQAVNTGKIIEGLTGGRITNTQIGLAIDGMTSPGITKDQALGNLNNLRDILYNKQENVIMGGMPKEQKDLIYKHYGVKPAWLMTAPKTHPTVGTPLDSDKSMEVGHPVYAAPGQ